MNFYLLHANVAVHLKRLGIPASVSAEPHKAGERAWQYRYLALCFSISLLGAILLTVLIEKPCGMLLKKLFNRKKHQYDTAKQKG